MMTEDIKYYKLNPNIFRDSQGDDSSRTIIGRGGIQFNISSHYCYIYSMTDSIYLGWDDIFKISPHPLSVNIYILSTQANPYGIRIFHNAHTWLFRDSNQLILTLPKEEGTAFEYGLI